MRVVLANFCSLGMHLGVLSFFFFEGSKLTPSLTLNNTLKSELTIQIAPMRKVLPLQELTPPEEKTLIRQPRAVAPRDLRKEHRAERVQPVPKQKALTPKTAEPERLSRADGGYESSLQPPPPRQVTPAEYASNPPPNYPEISRRKREEGTVLLLVSVDSEGRPEQVVVHQPARYARLNEAAKEAVARWRFSPASKVGLGGKVQYVSSQVVVPVTFSLTG